MNQLFCQVCIGETGIDDTALVSMDFQQRTCHEKRFNGKSGRSPISRGHGQGRGLTAVIYSKASKRLPPLRFLNR